MAAAGGDATIPAARFHYLESCGGCHGIEGVSSREHIPVLKDAVGKFLCTPAGRRYIVQLPNVAFADVDDATLAELMNYVIFQIGGSSTPLYTKPFRTSEVGALRRRALKNRPLADLRTSILVSADPACLRRR